MSVDSGAASQTETDSPNLNFGLQGTMTVLNSTFLLVRQWQCISSFVFDIQQSIQSD